MHIIDIAALRHIHRQQQETLTKLYVFTYLYINTGVWDKVGKRRYSFIC